MCTIFKVFIESFTILLLFYVSVSWHEMWTLSSMIRDWTCTPCIRRQSLNRWTTREVPDCIFTVASPKVIEFLIPSFLPQGLFLLASFICLWWPHAYFESETTGQYLKVSLFMHKILFLSLIFKNVPQISWGDIFKCLWVFCSFPSGAMVMNPPTNAKDTRDLRPSREHPLE